MKCLHKICCTKCDLHFVTEKNKLLSCLLAITDHWLQLQTKSAIFEIPRYKCIIVQRFMNILCKDLKLLNKMQTWRMSADHAHFVALSTIYQTGISHKLLKSQILNLQDSNTV